ncbi:MAG: 50S ribosomal protein L23 [candidate division WS1 bacterium]|jgi:large subunit ribosomal protein L23|nr:50S ribosomal protein L23 [candidate division WS1 bacterium]
MPSANTEIERYRKLILAPVISEKSMRESDELRKYTFRVHPDATKIDIKRAIEYLFNVRVTAVNTMNVVGKSRRRSYRHRIGKTAEWKKAIVTLAPGSSIDVV